MYQKAHAAIRADPTPKTKADKKVTKKRWTAARIGLCAILYIWTCFFTSGKHCCSSFSNLLTLGTRPASRLARFLCGTEAMVHMAKILATVSQMISVLAYH